MTGPVAVLGSTGLVGRAVCEAVRRRGADVVPVPAPRLTTSARTAAALQRGAYAEVVAGLSSSLAGAGAVVNAAGVADATAEAADAVYGANALLPLLVARARPDDARFVHVSSAAVQGRRPRLDETDEMAPFSPYSHAKALGEEVLVGLPGVVRFRPTSVQAGDREVTRRLVSLLGSRLASVAGDGTAPTPQVLLENVADAIAFTVLSEDPPPPVVLQPWEGLTTGSLVRIVGGREPRHVPRAVARATVAAAMAVGRLAPRVAGQGRRLEMLWFGQEQARGWLPEAGWRPVVGEEGWRRLSCGS